MNEIINFIRVSNVFSNVEVTNIVNIANRTYCKLLGIQLVGG